MQVHLAVSAWLRWGVRLILGVRAVLSIIKPARHFNMRAVILHIAEVFICLKRFLIVTVHKTELLDALIRVPLVLFVQRLLLLEVSHHQL